MLQTKATSIPHPAIRPSSESPVGCRQEREEGNRGRGRSQRQRRGHLARGPLQRFVQVAALVPFGPIADAELDAEVDAKSDEQDKERDREQVEGAHKRKAERGGHGKAHDHAKGNRGDDLP
jgi:hypothetical protein